MTDKKVFICTNQKQMIGALLSKYTIERFSSNLSKFGIEILNDDGDPRISRLTGKTYLRNGIKTKFFKEDLQSWTLLRFSPPKIMDYEGRSLVIDPDVFSVGGDVWQLFSEDVKEFDLLARPYKKFWASSVMLLDNTKLQHWNLESMVEDLLAFRADYRTLMSLATGKEYVGTLDSIWNDFDKIGADTCLLHTTMRITQPWRTGLPVEMVVEQGKPVLGLIPRKWIRRILGREKKQQFHQEHPDETVKNFFFSILNSAISDGAITKTWIEREVQMGNVRPDIWRVLDNYDNW